MMKRINELMKDLTRKLQQDWSFHVGIAWLMETLNLIEDALDSDSKSLKEGFEIFITHLFPYAPHVSSEIMHQNNFKLDLDINYDEWISQLTSSWELQV